MSIINKKDICVVIPIYKLELSNHEIQSVKQCVKILSDYSLYFVTSNELDITFYKKKIPEINNFLYFENQYFNDIQGYNRLMLSEKFYKSFEKYKYILIYQTDCYVFRDELLDWANKGFDYIGGILFENYIGNPYEGAKLWCPGNGGLSLRKTKSFITLLSSKRSLKGISKLFLEAKRLKTFGYLSYLKGLLLLPFRWIGYKNNPSYRAKTYTQNEDGYFIEVGLIYNALKIPKIEDTMNFSWDRYPDFLYEKLKQFPFACHAWFRDDELYENNKKFWFKKIEHYET